MQSRGARKATRLDPIALEIQWKRLVSMVDEASTAFIRTSFSVLVREANDFAVVLTDAQGRSLAQSTMSIASFIGSLPATVKHFLDVFPAKTLKPGDVMITNDPWMGTGHIHDVNVAMPIFHKGKLVAFAEKTAKERGAERIVALSTQAWRYFEQKCGFKGEAWTPDLKAHLNWCASVAPDVWKAQAQQRDQELAKCAKK